MHYNCCCGKIAKYNKLLSPNANTAPNAKVIQPLGLALERVLIDYVAAVLESRAAAYCS